MVERIHEQATALVAAYRANEYEKALQMTYPRIMELAGGREKMLALVKQAAGEMNKKDFKVDSVDVGEPSDPVQGNNKLFSIVPETLHLIMPHAIGESPGYLLAISADQGETWTFVDGAGLTAENVRSICPDFPDALKLPDKQTPSFLGFR